MAVFPLKLPGEPDILTQLRLSEELKLLRSLATQIGHTEAITRPPSPEAADRLLSQLPLETQEKLREAAREIWRPEAVAERIIAFSPVERIKPDLKARLLQVEGYFLEKGWNLPKWQRPAWLTSP
ncbi:hypothetical protein ES703_86710 [subsurface metagenome]